MNSTKFIPEHLKRWTMPSCYMGATWEGYFGAGFGQSRDSDCLEESNFAALMAGLKALPPWDSLEDDDEAVSRFVVRESHWAVGWVEWIAIHETDTAALEYCDKQKARFEDYPVLDESDFSEREERDAQTVWKDCYRISERVKYIRAHRSQFEFRSFADMLGCVRGNYFAGYASELIN